MNYVEISNAISAICDQNVLSSMERTVVDFLPLVTTGVAAAFAVVLFRHWRSKPTAKYLMWWTIGVTTYGLGTLAESLATVFGWSEPIFRLWYVTGALMGGVFLAQGVVYLLVSQKTASVIWFSAACLALAPFSLLALRILQARWKLAG